jgi:hypothetical protein
MASPSSGYNGEIRLNYGVSEIFCPKFLEGKTVESRFPGGRAMFAAVDGRVLFVDGEAASDIERSMRQLGIRPGKDSVRLTKIRHARGGGSSIEVHRVEQPDERGTLSTPRLSPRGPQPARAAAPPPLEATLEASVQLARQYGAQAFISNGGNPAPPAAPQMSDRARKLALCLIDAIDAAAAGQSHAKARDLGLTFASEDIRALAITCFIQDCQDSRFVGGQR